jgi:hypothetical protein
MKKIFIIALMALFAVSANVQGQETAEQREKANQQIQTKAAAWVGELKLNDAAKEARVAGVIATHQIAVRDYHNEHPATDIPDGINPRFPGTKMSGVEKQVFVNSAKPASVHENLMNGLRADLTEEQVEYILDKYTIGKVAFTMNGYRECIPDLTPTEDAALLAILKKWREVAVDYKNTNMISVIFEIAKSECELWLYQNDRNFKKLYKAWTDRLKAEKAAREAANN